MRKGSASWMEAEEHGLKVMEVAEAAKAGDLVMILLPDEVQGKVYNEQIAPNLEAENALLVRARLQHPIRTDYAAA